MTDTTTAPIGEDALREALWICVEHNALHFGETHNTVVQGRAALSTAAHLPTGWPRASISDSCLGWTLDYKFLDKVEQIAKSRTEYSTSMEATEQVLIAALEVLATAAIDAARAKQEHKP